jgi:hypothetical protein
MTAFTDDEWQVTATYDIERTREAQKLVAAAIAEIEREVPKFPRIQAKRLERIARFERARVDKEMLAAMVAQWMSERDRQATNNGAKDAVQRALTLADEVDALRKQLSTMAQTLRFAEKSGDGEHMAGYAELVENSLAHAMAYLRDAQEAARNMSAIMPKNAKGSAGVIGALRTAPPTEAFTLRLARYWQFCGLSTDGGEDGDGLDVVLERLLGPRLARKSLTRARRDLSIKTRKPQ